MVITWFLNLCFFKISFLKRILNSILIEDVELDVKIAILMGGIPRFFWSRTGYFIILDVLWMDVVDVLHVFVVLSNSSVER